MCRQSWSRREVLGAAVGTAAWSLTRRSYADVGSLPPEHVVCIDVPILRDGPATAPIREHGGVARAPMGAAAAPIGPSGRPLASPALAVTDPMYSLLATVSERDYAQSSRFAPVRAPNDVPTEPSRAAYLNRWPKDVLLVHFMEGSRTLRNFVLDKASEWSEFAKLDFREARNIGESDIRVGFANQGHWSFVGVESIPRRGEKTMNLQMNVDSARLPYNQGVILHEFGHALGCVHEHSSPRSPIRFKPARDLLQYFRGTGLEDVASIERNVIRRYQDSEMLRFSDFDPFSIMLYAFPQHFLVAGEATRQNTVLSKTDKEFATLLYPGRTTTTRTDGSGETSTAQSLTLTLGGGPVEGRLGAGRTVEAKLTVPSDQAGRDLHIMTEGATQVMLKLFGSDGRDLTPADGSGHGTYDLMNEVIALALPAGEYRVTATHPSRSGGGAFRIQAKSGRFERPLARPLKGL